MVYLTNRLILLHVTGTYYYLMGSYEKLLGNIHSYIKNNVYISNSYISIMMLFIKSFHKIKIVVSASTNNKIIIFKNMSPKYFTITQNFSLTMSVFK